MAKNIGFQTVPRNAHEMHRFDRIDTFAYLFSNLDASLYHILCACNMKTINNDDMYHTILLPKITQLRTLLLVCYFTSF